MPLIFLLATQGFGAFEKPVRSTPVQIRPTVQTTVSNFLVSDGAAYVASPIFAIKSATVYERFVWSSDGSQLAFISDSGTSLPGAQLQRLAKGEQAPNPQRIGVWNRDTGRIRDVLIPADSTTGFDKLLFLGRNLLFTTFSKTTPNRLWMAPETGPIRAVPLEGLSGGASFAASRRRPAVFVADNEKLWLITATQTRLVPLPADRRVSMRGVTITDQGIVRMFGPGSQPNWLADFDTGKLIPVPNEPTAIGSEATSPFILDVLQNRPVKAASPDKRAQDLIESSVPINEEDGGFQLNLVERSGPIRRRLGLAADANRYPMISDNGLSFAFVSNGVLMARCLVRTDTATTKKLLGTR